MNWLMIAGLCCFAAYLAWQDRAAIVAYVRVYLPVRKQTKRPTKKKPAAKAEPSGNSGELPKPAPDRRLVGGILAGAALMWLACQALTSSPGPTPDPVPIEGLDLRGTFVGPQAATDAAALAALCEELAASVEWDSHQERPVITTGVAFDDFRVRLRDILMRGDSIGARQPKARDAIAAYLDENCGNSGGPLSPEQRAKWVAAYRNIARASEAAYR